jgi:hypothetical protein
MFDTLSYIGEKLNEGNVTWGVGASLLLNHYGLINKPNDIDIIIAVEDIQKADIILKSIGEKKIWEKAELYSTKYFYEYVINGFEVDIMVDLSIKHEEGIYKYVFDNNSISEIKEVNGIDIPLTALEDWYVIYQLIPDREIKVKMIENYLIVNGIKNPSLLDRILKGNLPKKVRDSVQRILTLSSVDM